MASVLLLDLQLEILSWLPAPAVIRLRSVCKAWNTCTQHRNFTEKHLFRSIQLQQDPERRCHVLRLHPGRVRPEHNVSLEVEVGKDQKFSDPLARVPAYDFFVSTCNGQVCLQINTKQIGILKPMTNELLLLPVLTESNDVVCCAFGFGFEGENKTYKVVAWETRKNVNRPHTVVVCTIPLYGDPWPWKPLGKFLFLIPYQRPNVVVDQRYIIWVSGEPQATPTGIQIFPALLSFDMQDEKFKTLSVADVEPRQWNEKEAVLLPIEVDGCVGLVKLTGEKVEVWRRDQDQIRGDSWVQLFLLRNLAFESWINFDLACQRFTNVYCLWKGGTIFIGSENGYVSCDPKKNAYLVSVNMMSHPVICVPFVMSLVPLRLE